MLKFLRLSFFGMGKALSGKLSCPCDRSCVKCNAPWVFSRINMVDH